MLELLLCSMLTLFPDFLFRRFVQGKRLGREITLFSVWYELRWGITLCLILTVLLITVVLYNHPSSTNVTSLFRTISLFPEVGGRVSEVYVDYNQKVKKGDPLFKMDTTRQEAALERARLQVVEVDASMATAKADVLTSEGKLQEAKGALEQAQDELRTKSTLQQRNADTCGNTAGDCRCRGGRQGVGPNQDHDRLACAEGKCGSRACRSSGRTGQDDHLCRC
jgi:hypothetical protein